MTSILTGEYWLIQITESNKLRVLNKLGKWIMSNVIKQSAIEVLGDCNLNNSLVCNVNGNKPTHFET